jgi:alkylation response protein AidB-like acyl-CoA dehydrogenase
MSAVEVLPFLEAAAMGPAAGRMLVHVNNGIWRPLALYGTGDQRSLIGEVGAGKTIVGLAVTERGHGSGRDLGTTARREGDGWRLQGEKYLITFARFADHFIVLAAVTDDEDGERALTTFLVPAGSDGVEVEADPMMGLAGIGLGTVSFDSHLDGNAMLGKVGQGFAVFNAFMSYSRISVAACMVGLAQCALDKAVEFATTRATFGKPIADRQMIQTHLARMYASVFAGRAMVRSAAEKLVGEADDTAVAAAAAKMTCADIVCHVTDLALKVHGGYGYTRSSGIERIYRDARSAWFEEGTAEVQELQIARHLLQPHGRA